MSATWGPTHVARFREAFRFEEQDDVARVHVCDACALLFHTSVVLGNTRDGCECRRPDCGCRIKREQEATSGDG